MQTYVGALGATWSTPERTAMAHQLVQRPAMTAAAGLGAWACLIYACDPCAYAAGIASACTSARTLHGYDKCTDCACLRAKQMLKCGANLTTCWLGQCDGAPDN